MNFYEARELFKNMYKEIPVAFEFDEQCIHSLETLYTEGKMHAQNHVEYRRVKVTPNGMDSFYVPIQPHRMLASASYIKKKIPKDEIHFHSHDKINFTKATDEEKIVKLKELSDLTGMTPEEIKIRLE